MYNGHVMWEIDDIPTVLTNVRGNYAKGFIVNKDLTTTPCYVARVGAFYAHGDTLHRAVEDAKSKDMTARPVEERIAAFIAAYPTLDTECTGKALYEWHGILTGSCRAGRDAWCRDNGYDPKKARMTVREFCKQTQGAYGGAAIAKLLKAYEEV